MNTWEEVLALDSSDPMEVRAEFLVEQDDKLIESLIGTRIANGLSQKEVAERLGLTQATIASFERADNDPKLSTIRRYAMAVEALISHNVQRDQGQLVGAFENRWTSRAETTFRGSVENLKSSHPWRNFDAIVPNNSRNHFCLAS